VRSVEREVEQLVEQLFLFKRFKELGIMLMAAAVAMEFQFAKFKF
jgi:hypothetical protein